MSDESTGLALREAVAVKVMRWKRGKVSARDPGPYWDESCVHRWKDDIGPTREYWEPTCNIADAWLVVEKLAGGALPRYGFCRYSVPGMSSMMRGVAVCFHSSVHPPDIGGEGYWGYSWEADTDEENTAIAICRAAVALAEAEEKNSDEG